MIRSPLAAAQFARLKSKIFSKKNKSRAQKKRNKSAPQNLERGGEKFKKAQKNLRGLLGFSLGFGFGL